MLVGFGHDLHFADGPAVPFLGFPYPTRMAVAKLSTGKVWVWSPIALTKELTAAVAAIGPVAYIVSPNKLHHLFDRTWRVHDQQGARVDRDRLELDLIRPTSGRVL